MERTILKFENITGTSRKFHLQNINFTLPAGYIMGLMGNNGAGKTTLLRYIMDPKQLYTGNIYIDNINIRENHDYMKNKIGYISEDNIFFKERTAKQNVELLHSFYENFDMNLFHEVMHQMNVSENITYNRMSRGECLKFQMAFAMAHHPLIYLLDEVTVGMDPVFRIDFFKILQNVILEENASVLLTSHIASEIERKTDYVGILDKGKLTLFGESIDIIGDYSHA